MTQQKILLASFQNGPIPKKKLSQTKPNWTQRNLKTRHDVPVWGMFRIHTGRERKINKITFYFFEKMSIWGPQVQRRTDDNGLSFFFSLCRYKDDITQPRNTYQPRWPHLRCWRSECSGSLWRSQPGPPPWKTHTNTHMVRQNTSSESISHWWRGFVSQTGGGRKWVVLIKAQPYVALEEVKKKRKKKKL